MKTKFVEDDQIKRVDIHSRFETEAAASIHIDTFAKGTWDHHDCILALWGLLNLISFALRSSWNNSPFVFCFTRHEVTFYVIESSVYRYNAYINWDNLPCILFEKINEIIKKFV